MFLECPASAVTNKTWHLIGLVNDCLDTDGNIIIPPISGGLLEQPPWFRPVKAIICAERAEYRRQEQEKLEAKAGSGRNKKRKRKRKR